MGGLLQESFHCKLAKAGKAQGTDRFLSLANGRRLALVAWRRRRHRLLRLHGPGECHDHAVHAGMQAACTTLVSSAGMCLALGENASPAKL